MTRFQFLLSIITSPLVALEIISKSDGAITSDFEVDYWKLECELRTDDYHRLMNEMDYWKDRTKKAESDLVNDDA